MGEAQWISAFSSGGKNKAQWKVKQWGEAFRKQDGYRLLILLREKPDLILVTYCGCNVLHLAIRKRWYGLVREVLLKFCPLRTPSRSRDTQDLQSSPKSSSSRSRPANPGEDTQDLQSSPKSSSSRSEPANPGEDTQDLQSGPTEYLSQDQFWWLLEGKEPVDERSSSTEDGNWKYRSGLDVLAMAVIQGHGAINTILAEAVQTVGGAPHYYAGGEVIRFMDGKRETKNVFYKPERREVLRNIIEECFTDRSTENQVDKINDPETANEGADVAPNSPASETGSQASSSDSGPNLQQRRRLEDQIDAAWKKEWMVTSPFLPFEEFLFLACCLHTSTWQGNFSDDDKVRSARAKVLQCCAWELLNADFLNYLLNISDTWGEAIHHAVHAEETERPHSTLGLVLAMMRIADDGLAFDFRHWVNSRDSSGRTALYTALALGLRDAAECLLSVGESELMDVEACRDAKACGRWKFGEAACEIDVKAVSERNGYSPHESSSESDTLRFHSILRSPHLPELVQSSHGGWITFMLWAVYTGDVASVQYYAEDDMLYDAARLHNSTHLYPESRVTGLLNCSALHVAAAAGHPRTIRAILASGKFDPLVEDWEGNTALHLATHFELPLHFPHSLADFCLIPDRRIGNLYTDAKDSEKLIRIAESRRQGCINLLLQAGIDVWQTNRKKEIADPGPNCSPEYSTWWYERVSKETQEAKTSLNAGANAISVTAALVATASYVGPLQPPLGYAAQSEGLTEKMQVGDLTVRIFIVCNTLAFYLALAAIMLSLTPSLPMPRESILDELKLIRRAVTASVGILIMSILAVLIAFAAASIAVIPDEDSWNHGGLTVSTIGVGGFICSLVLLLCLFRVVRLTFHSNQKVRRFYQRYVCM